MLSETRLARSAAVAVIASVMALGCSGTDAVAPPPVHVASVIFAAPNDSIVVGQTRQLSVTTRDAGDHPLTGRSVTWSVQDSTVASVTGTGTITALKLGSTQVIAQSEGVSASQTLTVVRVPVAMVAFAVATQSINVGDSVVVSAVVTDAAGAILTDRSVSYSSAAPAILQVSATGTVVGVAPGIASVTATSGGISGALSVHVQALPVARIVINPHTLDVATGASGLLTIQALDARNNVASSSALTYLSSNPSVVSVQPPGRFVAIAPGSAVITIGSDGVSGTIPVTVQVLQPAAFHFDLRFVGPPDANIEAAAQRAAARWERVLPAALAAQAVDLPAAACETLAPAITGNTTGIIVTIAKDSIDGRSKTLAEAGPCVLRTGKDFVLVGAVDLDSADVASMVQRGTLENVITHELGHVLGIGVLWQDGTRHQLLTDTASDDPRYIGPAAVHAATDLGFLGADSARGVQVENVGGPGSRLGHWRESVYSTELMTSIDGPGNVAPLSRISVGSLHDLGFTTRDAGADFFTAATTRTGGLPVSGGVSPSLSILIGERTDHEVLRMPRFVATPSGRAVPIQRAGNVRRVVPN